MTKFTFLLFTSSTLQAEIWLTDTLYLENNHYLILKNLNSNTSQPSNSALRLLPEFSLTQAIHSSFLPTSNITLASKFDLLNNENSIRTQGIISELNVSTAFGSHWAFIFGRQKISYAQPDLFNTSLNKNDFRPEPLGELNYSQGLLTRYRLGFVEQSLLLNQQTQANEENPFSAHYQLKVGIPGYKVGPAKVVISYDNHNEIIRGMFGSALQFPLQVIPGDWQWAFQYAQEFNNSQVTGNQAAWQTSFSWLGFIPQHKLGILFNHSDEEWIYSDDFSAGENGMEIRYQWTAQQNFNIELGASQRRNFLAVNPQTEKEINMRLNLLF